MSLFYSIFLSIYFYVYFDVDVDVEVMSGQRKSVLAIDAYVLRSR